MGLVSEMQLRAVEDTAFQQGLKDRAAQLEVDRMLASCQRHAAGLERAYLAYRALVQESNAYFAAQAEATKSRRRARKMPADDRLAHIFVKLFGLPDWPGRDPVRELLDFLNVRRSVAVAVRLERDRTRGHDGGGRARVRRTRPARRIPNEPVAKPCSDGPTFHHIRFVPPANLSWIDPCAVAGHRW